MWPSISPGMCGSGKAVPTGGHTFRSSPRLVPPRPPLSCPPQWLLVNATCPSCRAGILPDSGKAEGEADSDSDNETTYTAPEPGLQGGSRRGSEEGVEVAEGMRGGSGGGGGGGGTPGSEADGEDGDGRGGVAAQGDQRSYARRDVESARARAWW